MKSRQVRVPDELWEACQARAQREHVPLSIVIRWALANYAGGGEMPLPAGHFRDRHGNIHPL